MKDVKIKGNYENAKKIAIAFWAQRIANGTLSQEYEETVVKYKAMLMTDIVTLNKQGRFDEAKKLQARAIHMKELIQGNVSLTGDLQHYIVHRQDLTCVKRKPKTAYEKMCDFFTKLDVSNAELAKLIKQYVKEHEVK